MRFHPTILVRIKLIAICFFAIGSLFAQSKAQLELNRSKVKSKLSKTKKLLKENSQSLDTAMDRLQILDNQIELRKELSEILALELDFIETSICRTDEVIEALKNDLVLLKEEFSKTVRSTYHEKLNNSSTLFLFASDGFNNAFQRYRYLKQYKAYRIKQAKLIIETQNALETKAVNLEQRYVEQSQLLQDAQVVEERMFEEINEKEKLIQKLKNNADWLAVELKKQKSANSKLNSKIQSVISAQIAQNEKKLKKPKIHQETPRAMKVGNSFINMKGDLNWPVDGFVTKYFGKQAHSFNKNVIIENNGIDIRTEKNSSVNALFQGTVTGVSFIPGFNNTVIIQHGEYYTVYSNLDKVVVSKGQDVSANQVLGKVFVHPTKNASVLHLEVWKDRTRLNPIKWLKKKK